MVEVQGDVNKPPPIKGEHPERVEGSRLKESIRRDGNDNLATVTEHPRGRRQFQAVTYRTE